MIPPKFSELLLSLVSNHISDVRVRQWEATARHDSTLQIDLVRGKGRGLIILLHGQFPASWRNLPFPQQLMWRIFFPMPGFVLGGVNSGVFFRLLEGTRKL